MSSSDYGWSLFQRREYKTERLDTPTVASRAFDAAKELAKARKRAKKMKGLDDEVDGLNG